MKGFYEWTCSPKCSTRGPGNSPNRIFSSYHSAEEANSSRDSRNTLWSSFFGYTTSILETYSELSSSKKNTSKGRDNGWTISVKKIFRGTSMRRLHERLLGSSRTGTCSSSSDIWLLGSCYKISKEGNEDSTSENGLAAFESDFSSRILITYRKGFECIGDSKWTSDVGWGCMLRSSQMLIAQALMFHRLGRYWRRNTEEMGEYTQLLRLFGDSKSCCFSIHNLLEAGRSYGLGPGSWVGPYATCRAWEALVLRLGIEEKHPLLVHVVSGDENGERGGAPAVCCREILKSCSELFSSRPVPVVLLVPLVLGLEKINPRYIPLLRETFTFPQSLGILGGRPGASTYIIGVQDDNAFYLDPHEVQPVVEVKENVPGVSEASSYHCSTVRRLLFDTIDSSLAIGFYCRDRGDLRDFCDRASLLAEHSGGAPLFTVAREQAPEAAATDAALHVAAAACDGDVWLRERDDDWQLL